MKLMQGYGNQILDGISGDFNILIDEIKEEYLKRMVVVSIVEKEISVIDAIIDPMFLLEPRGLEVVNIATGELNTEKLSEYLGRVPDINLGLVIYL
jgi:hypothetical protein